MTREDWRAAWTEALDALELDVEAVETLLQDEHRSRETPLSDPWRPPAGLGPLPLDLRPRADAILGRQLAAAQAVALELATNRRQVALLGAVETGDAPKRPAYVDCAM
jgi:hypothetical protein